jgi:hypothetical protein
MEAESIIFSSKCHFENLLGNVSDFKGRNVLATKLEKLSFFLV